MPEAVGTVGVGVGVVANVHVISSEPSLADARVYVSHELTTLPDELSMRARPLALAWACASRAADTATARIVRPLKATRLRVIISFSPLQGSRRRSCEFSVVLSTS